MSEAELQAIESRLTNAVLAINGVRSIATKWAYESLPDRAYESLRDHLRDIREGRLFEDIDALVAEIRKAWG